MRNHNFKDSSALSGFKYNPDSQQLDVRFKSGRTYTFHQVPSALIDEFEACDSAGRFYHERLKGNYGE